MTETDRRILRNPADKISNHKPSWGTWGAHWPKPAAGRPAAGGQHVAADTGAATAAGGIGRAAGRGRRGQAAASNSVWPPP